jgi:hypothetical protein
LVVKWKVRCVWAKHGRVVRRRHSHDSVMMPAVARHHVSADSLSSAIAPLLRNTPYILLLCNQYPGKRVKMGFSLNNPLPSSMASK